jgi:hypothetical protein
MFTAILIENLSFTSHILAIFHLRGRFMADVRLVAESVFDRNRRREAEIDEALKQEAARHEAAVKNMHRLRALRLARAAKSNNE